MSDNPMPPALQFALGLIMRALDDFSKLTPEDQAVYADACGLDNTAMTQAFRELGEYFTRAARIAEANRRDQQRQPGVLQ
jgi:hypothetical protein